MGYRPSLPTCWAGGWWSNSSLPSGSTPKLGAIACWSNHVAVVEAINGNTITISESSYVQGSYSSNNLFATRTLSATNPSNGYDQFYGYIYIGDFSTPTTPNITVGTGDVTDITETNAVVRGTVNKDSSITSGMRCGVRIGTSANNFNVVSGYWEDVSAAAYNSNNGTSFPMWYNVNSELGVTLKKGTTYYYQMMASYGGKTYYGEVKSFRTAGDGTKPTITNYRIVSVNKDQFTVECTATDNVGVAYIKFLSWGSGQTWDKNGVTHDVNTTNGTATTTFKLSELKCYTTGTYAVDLRAYDKAGNVSDIKYLRFTVDRTAPVISNVKVSDCNATGYTVTCTVTDNIGVSKVQFPAWTTNNGQDDLLADWKTNAKASGTKNGNTYTYRVNVSDHKNELGEYQTKIYACDAAGNYQEIVVSKVTLKKETQQTNPADGQNPGNIPPSGPNNNQENTGGAENEQKDSTVTEKTKKAKIKKKRGTIKSLKNIKGKKVVLKLKKVSGATGYEVRYSTNKKFKKSVKKVKTTSLKVTLKKLKKGKKYYVKVRPYYKDSNGKYTYGKYSSVKKITIRK